MKRKEFIYNSSLLIAGSMMAREQLAEIVTGEIIYGQNEKRYRLVKDWVKADPATLSVNDCHEMVQDAEGRIALLTNETKNNVIFFSKSGKLLETWGHDFPGAHGLTIWGEKEQFLFITDTEKNEFYKTALDGKILQTWRYPVESGKYDDPKTFVPTETTVTKSGEIYVADGYGIQYITHYDAQGKIKNIFGGRGNEEKNLDNAHGITIDYRTMPETLIITDRTRCCFKRFSMSGDYIETISLPGACVCRPVIKGNYLYAAVLRSPTLDNVDSGFVIILNKENKVVSVLCGSEAIYDNGKPKPFYQTDKLFKHPHDVMVDDDENLYVCQWSSGKVYPYKFEPVK
ncbi:MAG TPA: 6-bladed beta-propeller [Chitinophagaceae bacterium]|nr:6-bladed beta-propeller [Chitinophagaceae bacterium]